MLTKHLKPQYKGNPLLIPNLPQGEVTLAAISTKAGEAKKNLEALGVECVTVSADKRLPLPICDHPDIQMLHLGERDILTTAEHLCAGDLNRKFNVSRIGAECSDKYPDDVLLNCTLIGKHIICNEKTVAREVLEYAYKAGLNIINVNQGYSRCSVCVVDENCIITDDIGIFRSAQFFLDDVLLVSKNSIRLNGYNYGFIGGCSGKIGKDKIGFNGRLESHSDYKLIEEFLCRHNVSAVELSSEVLNDTGGILPLLEIKP